MAAEEMGWTLKWVDGKCWYSKDGKTWYTWDHESEEPRKVFEEVILK